MLLSKRVIGPLATLALVQSFSLAQTYIPQPQDVTFQLSSVLPGASLSFKEVCIIPRQQFA